MKSATTRAAVTRDSPVMKQGAQAGTGEVHPTGAKVPPPARRKEERPRVAWYATLLIVLMLLMGAGWELWRWLLLVITLD
jgi:hypothetical protein